MASAIVLKRRQIALRISLSLSDLVMVRATWCSVGDGLGSAAFGWSVRVIVLPGSTRVPGDVSCSATTPAAPAGAVATVRPACWRAARASAAL